MNNLAVSSHAILSPSGGDRWITCAGSRRLIEQLKNAGKIPKEDTTSEAAALGTCAHEMGEKRLLKPFSLVEQVGKTVSSDGFDFVVDYNFIEAVQVYIDYCSLIFDTLVIDSPAAEFRTAMQVEVNCSLKSYRVEGMDGGTSDCVIYDPDLKKVYVIDYKHGSGKMVEVENNVQAMQYGLGMLLELGIEPGDDWEVVLVIVQPRIYHPDGQCREWSISSDDLHQWASDVLIPAGEATWEVDAPFTATNEACYWCEAKAHCKANWEYGQQLATRDFETIDVIGVPEIETLTAKQKIMLLENASFLTKFIAAVEKDVKEQLRQGDEEYTAAFKMVRGRANRKFTPLAFDDVFSPLLDVLDLSEITKQVPLNIGEVEGALKSKVTKLEVANIMAQVTEKPEGALTMVPLSDKREAVTLDARSEFAALADVEG